MRASLVLPFSILAACALAASAAASDPFLRRTAAVQAVEKVGPAVVNVTTETEVRQQNPFEGFQGDPLFDRFFRDFFEPSQPRTMQSLGSGVIIDADGHVLTNEHVVARASRIKVSLADGREFDAKLVGADANNDLAVLRVETKEKLPWVAPGESNDILVGESVIAIGNPFGLSNTVTTGVISALDRSIRAGDDKSYHGFLQTDASINPGNSGGPLLNAEGSLIGINTAIYQGAEGIGFAIPIDVAKRVVEHLIAHGHIDPVWLGIELQDLDPDLHEAMELPRGTRGALVTGVTKGGPAERAGLRRGDLVTHLGGHKIETARDFHSIVEASSPEQDLEVEVLRDGKSEKLVARAERISDAGVEALADRLLGLSLARTESGYRVKAVRARSAAERIGFRADDLVLGINGTPLESTDSLRRAVLDLQGRASALVVVQRGGGRYHVTVPLS